MGKDVYQQDWYPEPGQVYWKQNSEDQSLGWEFVAGTGIEGDPYKEDTYIASWKNGYAYDPDGNQININGKGIFNPNIMGLSNEEQRQIRDDVMCMSGGVKFLTPRLLNELKALALCNQDLMFATKEQALEFISKKFSNIPEEVAQKRSAEGWHFDSHPIKGSTESVDHINMYSKELGFRIHITWRN